MKRSEEGQEAVCGVIAKLDRPWKNDKQKARFHGCGGTELGRETRGIRRPGVDMDSLEYNVSVLETMGPAHYNGSANTWLEVSSRYKMGKEPGRQSV